MMPSASLSAAASAAVSTSSMALGVAVTSTCRPPSVGSFTLLASHARVSFPSAVPVRLRCARSLAGLAVQPALDDVLHPPFRDQVPDRLARVYPGPALG